MRRFRIEERDGYLLAELSGREAAADMRAFVLAVHEACRRHGCPRIVMSISRSRALFKPEDYGLASGGGGYARELVTPACHIALVGDTPELNAAHEYIEVVARQQHVNVRAFRDEASAVRWLTGTPAPSRRYKFAKLVLLGAPRDAGVYALWEGEELIYYGRAMGGETTIRSRLLEHFEGRDDLLTGRATHYSWEVCADPVAREAALLAEYERMFGRLPRCNAARR